MDLKVILPYREKLHNKKDWIIDDPVFAKLVTWELIAA